MVTDGFHLYEIVGEIRNYGLLGGAFLVVQDCATLARRVMGILEQQLCETVQA